MKRTLAVSFPKMLIGLGILAFFSVLNETVFNVSLPDIAGDFALDSSAANWVNTSFILSFAAGTAIYGKISDVCGVRRLLIIGLLIYGTGSIAGWLLHGSFPAVLAARFIQGAGASAVPGLIMVIVTRYMEPRHQGKAFGLIGSLVAFGEGIGPVLGGLIADFVHWSHLFVLPLMALLALPFIARALPQEPSKKSSLDIAGALLLVLGIMAFGLFTTRYEWPYMAASLLLFIGFALRIRRAKEPLIEPALLRRRRFIAVVLAGGILLGAVAGLLSMIPYMMKDVHRMATSVIGSGILFPGTLSVILFGMLGGAMVDKRGPYGVMLAGLSCIGAGLLIVALAADEAPWLIAGALIAVFAGLSFVKTVISTIAASALAPEEAGAGMGFLNFACFVAEGIGIAVVGGLLVQQRLAVPMLPAVTDALAYRYSSLALLLLAAVIAGAIVFLLAFRGRRGSTMDEEPGQ